MYQLITVNGGHSATSKGANGNGYQEHLVARTIKDKLIGAFRNVGQKTADTTSDGTSQSSVLHEQVFKCNLYQGGTQLDVSIHLNAGGGTGVEVLYYDQKQLASVISQSIATSLGIRDRGAKQRKDLYFLNQTKHPAILIEVCFIDNAEDMKRLMGNMDSMVNEIVKVLTGKVVSGVQDYTVRSGESLTKIAQRNGTTVKEIMSLNPQITNSNLIRSGQVIKIPKK